MLPPLRDATFAAQRRLTTMTANTKRVLILVTTLGFATSLLATMDDQKAFGTKYPDAKAKLAKCSTCHEKAMPKKEDHANNPYGADLEKTVADPKAAKKVIDFAKVEAMDSDGDGVKNIDEIKAGTNPGD